MYYPRQRGRKYHGLYRNMLSYVGTSDEGNINLIGLEGELSILYGWKNPLYTRKGKIYLVC